MVNLQREGLGLLLKLGRAIASSEYATEAPEEEDITETTESTEAAQMVYWEKDREQLDSEHLPYIDILTKGVALERIPDSTEKPVKESHYDLDRLSQLFWPELKNINFNIKTGVTEGGVPKAGTGISSSGRDAGVVAGIVVAVISGVIILAALIAVVLYRHYVHRNVTSMNFDNPVYRKTTEDQFALEKNGYAPGSKLYPSTVGEEAQEPLNSPGTNDFV